MIITTKFVSKCKNCGKSISPGERVSWVQGVSGIKHMACSEEGQKYINSLSESKAVMANIDIPCPEGYKYLPYQKAGVKYALEHNGVLFGDEMGLGKTIEVIGFINLDETIKTVLIICPKSLTLNWKREINRWLTRNLSYSIIFDYYFVVIPDIIICSYEQAKNYQNFLTLRKWDLMVIDEAHYIKNYKSQRAICIHEIGKYANRKFALTGTPICNRPVELFGILKFVCSEVWDKGGIGFKYFSKRYCNAHQERYGKKKIWIVTGSSNLEELQEKLRATCMIRRLKKDVLTELPPKRRQIIELPIEGNEEIIRAEVVAFSSYQEKIDSFEIALTLVNIADDRYSYEQAAMRLEQAYKVAFEEIAIQRISVARSKIPYVVEHVKTILEESNKIVLMAHHHEIIDALQSQLSEFNPVTLTGKTKLEDRQKAVDTFQNDDSCKIFIGSIQAAGVGITLTASSNVIFVELDPVPGNMTQAEDRLHRIGQNNSVLVQHFVFDDSIDARFVQLLIQKQEILFAALDKEFQVKAEIDKVVLELTAE